MLLQTGVSLVVVEVDGERRLLYCVMSDIVRTVYCVQLTNETSLKLTARVTLCVLRTAD